MSGIERAKRAVADRWGRGDRPWLAEETRARLTAAVLWLLIVIAAVSGVVALVRPVPAPSNGHAGGEPPAATVSEAWAAGGFGARAVAAYLTSESGQGESVFAAFLGGEPAPTDRETTTGPPVAVIAVDRAGDGYWAVTVAAGDADGEQFWRVGVAARDGRLVATGLPTPVAVPPAGERADLAVTSWETPPVDDPLVETVAGWIAAYACGQGEVSRWLAPGVRLGAVTPPLCREARVDRWGTRPDGDDRVLVVTEVALDPGASERRVTFALVLGRRDGRWEVAELLPAPPLSDEEVDG